jgi:hypothetical protein
MRRGAFGTGLVVLAPVVAACGSLLALSDVPPTDTHDAAVDDAGDTGEGDGGASPNREAGLDAGTPDGATAFCPSHPGMLLCYDFDDDAEAPSPQTEGSQGSIDYLLVGASSPPRCVRSTLADGINDGSFLSWENAISRFDRTSDTVNMTFAFRVDQVGSLGPVRFAALTGPLYSLAFDVDATAGTLGTVSAYWYENPDVNLGAAISCGSWQVGAWSSLRMTLSPAGVLCGGAVAALPYPGGTVASTASFRVLLGVVQNSSGGTAVISYDDLLLGKP